MYQIFRVTARPLRSLFVLSIAAVPLLAQQPTSAAATPLAPAPMTAPATTSAPQPSPLFAQNDDHPATIAAAKEENARAMRSSTAITMTTMMVVMLVVLLVLLIV